MTTPRNLSSRYELGEILGFGGMSEVHLARDVRLSRDVAIKVLRADLARDPTFYLRFRREAQNAAALNHPAIVAVYDTGEAETDAGPLPYIVMEYVDGDTLRDIVRSEGPMAPRRAMEVISDVCAALDFSHRNGIVHRDVKPANVMINRAGAVKVMDFGIARAISDASSPMTQTAAVIGTAQYLSPEQARGEQVDARSDVYSLGCVLFEILTGEPPFKGDSPVAVAYQHVREDPQTPSAVNPDIPRELDSVILKAMSKNPANRYQTAGGHAQRPGPGAGRAAPERADGDERRGPHHDPRCRRLRRGELPAPARHRSATAAAKTDARRARQEEEPDADGAARVGRPHRRRHRRRVPVVRRTGFEGRSGDHAATSRTRPRTTPRRRCRTSASASPGSRNRTPSWPPATSSPPAPSAGCRWTRAARSPSRCLRAPNR